MVEDDPSVMDLLTGKVIDPMGILRQLRVEDDLDYRQMLELRNFLNAEMEQEREAEKKHGDVNPGHVTHVTDALLNDLYAACGEYMDAGLTEANASKKAIKTALNAFLPRDACVAMKQWLRAQKKDRETIENEVC